MSESESSRPEADVQAGLTDAGPGWHRDNRPVWALVERENTRAAQERADRLAASNRVLQQTIESIASIKSLDELVPRILRIACEAFGAAGASFFENRDDLQVRLLYWDEQGLTMNPGELLQSDEQGEITIRMLAEGFESPPDYVDPRTPGVTILNHLAGTGQAHFDEFCLRHGYELEMNVGVGALRRTSTLVVYRGTTEPFTEADIELAQALASQLGLALETQKLAARAQEAAIAKERAAELSKANAALRSTLAQLSGAPDLERFLTTIMRESMRQLNAQDGALLLYDAKTESLTMLQVVSAASELPAILRTEATFPADITDGWRRMVDKRGPVVFDPVAEAASFWPGTADWHVSRGNLAVICVPMFLAEEPFGFLGFGVQRPRQSISVLNTELLEALTQQATLALYMHRMAERLKESAIAIEREAAAEQRAQDSERFIEALQKSVDALATVGTGPDFIPAVLQIVKKALSATMAAYYDHLASGEILLRYFHADTFQVIA